MLPTWMIEELERARREQAQREERARIWIEQPEMPVDAPSPGRERDDASRGVIVIDLLG